MNLLHTQAIIDEGVDIAILPKEIKDRIAKIELASNAPNLSEDDIDDLEIESADIANEIYNFLDTWEDMTVEQRADHIDANN